MAISFKEFVKRAKSGAYGKGVTITKKPKPSKRKKPSPVKKSKPKPKPKPKPSLFEKSFGKTQPISKPKPKTKQNLNLLYLKNHLEKLSQYPNLNLNLNPNLNPNQRRLKLNKINFNQELKI